MNKEEFFDKYENALWQTAFPYCYMAGESEGTYQVKDMHELLERLELGIGLSREKSRAEARLDISLSAMWDLVKDKFPINLFPHRLAAATDILRAVNFGCNQENSQVTAMAQETMEALDHLEKTLAFFAQYDNVQEPQDDDKETEKEQEQESDNDTDKDNKPEKNSAEDKN